MCAKSLRGSAGGEGLPYKDYLVPSKRRHTCVHLCPWSVRPDALHDVDCGERERERVFVLLNRYVCYCVLYFIFVIIISFSHNIFTSHIHNTINITTIQMYVLIEIKEKEGEGELWGCEPCRRPRGRRGRVQGSELDARWSQPPQGL